MIETVQDWNDRLGYCGCCPMPVCPEFLIRVERKYAVGQPCGLQIFEVYPEDDPQPTCETLTQLYKKGISRDTSDTVGYGFGSTEYISDYSIVDGVCTSDLTGPFIVGIGGVAPHGDSVYVGSSWVGSTRIQTYTYDDGEGGDWNGTYTDEFEYAEPLTAAETETMCLDDAQAQIDDQGWQDLGEGLASSSLLLNLYSKREDDMMTSGDCPESESFSSIVWDIMRFRIRVPFDHKGSKYKITYDLVDYPDVGDPVIFSSSTIEWTGPGTGTESDESWLTEWVEIEVPDYSAERRVQNVRYTCYTGTKFGVKPQVVGDAFEPPP